MGSLGLGFRGIVLGLYRDNGKENGNYYNTGGPKKLPISRVHGFGMWLGLPCRS